MKRCSINALVTAGLLFVAGCSEWQHDVTLHGVTFSKVRTVSDGHLIGQIAADTVVQGRPCAQGWLHLHSNGVPAMFAATQEIAMARFSIPTGTWVFQDSAGVVTICAFPQDTLVQGYYVQITADPVARHVLMAMQSDKDLQQLDIDDSRRNAALVFEAGKQFVPARERKAFATTCLLAMHLTGSTVRLAVAVGPAEGERLVVAHRALLQAQLRAAMHLA